MSTVDKINWVFLVVAGGIIHLVMDWFAQNHWQATNKMKRRIRTRYTRVTTNYDEGALITTHHEGPWWDRDPAAYAHAGLHTLPMLLIFPVWAALIIGVLHLIIDTRSPLEWWGKFTRQTQPANIQVTTLNGDVAELPPTVMDVGREVGFWRDQTAHIAVIGLVALLCVA